MPANENTVVIPSIIGFLSCVKYKTTIANAVKINVIAKSMSRSFFEIIIVCYFTSVHFSLRIQHVYGVLDQEFSYGYEDFPGLPQEARPYR